MVDIEIEAFINRQIATASGRRLEMLKKDLTGTKKMLRQLIWPVFQSFEGFVLEYELVSLSGARIYVDVFYEPLGLAFECEGFFVHAESITRDRFTFERMRARTIAEYGYKYIPFTWDEMDKNSIACCRSLYGLIGKFNLQLESELSLFECEVLRRARLLNQPFRISDVEGWLQVKEDLGRKIIKKLLSKKLIKPFNPDKQRIYKYVLGEDAYKDMY